MWNSYVIGNIWEIHELDPTHYNNNNDVVIIIILMYGCTLLFAEWDVLSFHQQLRNYLISSGRQISRNQLLNYAKQLGAAMCYLEAKKFVHRWVAVRGGADDHVIPL